MKPPRPVMILILNDLTVFLIHSIAIVNENLFAIALVIKVSGNNKFN